MFEKATLLESVLFFLFVLVSSIDFENYLQNDLMRQFVPLI